MLIKNKGSLRNRHSQKEPNKEWKLKAYPEWDVEKKKTIRFKKTTKKISVIMNFS